MSSNVRKFNAWNIFFNNDQKCTDFLHIICLYENLSKQNLSTANFWHKKSQTTVYTHWTCSNSPKARILLCTGISKGVELAKNPFTASPKCFTTSRSLFYLEVMYACAIYHNISNGCSKFKLSYSRHKHCNHFAANLMKFIVIKPS